MPNFPKNEHFLPTDNNTYIGASGGKKYLFFRKFDVLCFLGTPVLRFVFVLKQVSAVIRFPFLQVHEFDNCRFDVNVGDCVYYLRTSDPDERQKWVDVLETAKVNTFCIFVFIKRFTYFKVYCVRSAWLLFCSFNPLTANDPIILPSHQFICAATHWLVSM